MTANASAGFDRTMREQPRRSKAAPTPALALALALTIAALSSPLSVAADSAAVDDPAEALFRKALARHRRARTSAERWGAWSDLSPPLLSLLPDRPLEAVGAFEESILTIEREVARSSGGGRGGGSG